MIRQGTHLEAVKEDFQMAAQRYDWAWSRMLDALLDADAPVEDLFQHIRRRPRYTGEGLPSGGGI